MCSPATQPSPMIPTPRVRPCPISSLMLLTFRTSLAPSVPMVPWSENRRNPHRGLAPPAGYPFMRQRGHQPSP